MRNMGMCVCVTVGDFEFCTKFAAGFNTFMIFATKLQNGERPGVAIKHCCWRYRDNRETGKIAHAKVSDLELVSLHVQVFEK